MEIKVPQDRSRSFEPLLIAKGQSRFEGFDEKNHPMYARGMTVRRSAIDAAWDIWYSTFPRIDLRPPFSGPHFL